VPGASLGTVALGINDAGQIVGSFFGGTPQGTTHGFLNTGGVFTTIDPPGTSFTEARGINDARQIVGRFLDATGAHGFLLTGGIFTTIDVPGASLLGTAAFGINDAGQIVGNFSDGTGGHGFLALPTAVPGAGTLMLVTSGLLAVAAGGCARRWRLAGRRQCESGLMTSV
jgi:uncharacterized membrane protein